MNPDIRVITLTKRWVHHIASGGYDRLADWLGKETVPRPPLSRWPWSRLARSRWRKKTQVPKYLLDYEYEDLRAERKLLRKARASRPDVIHVLYGDEQLDFLLRKRSRLPCPLVATFHFPGQRVKDRFDIFHKDLLAGVNAAVVVSRCQMPDFARWFGAERVFYVPHGIDTERFAPAVNPLRQPELRLLTVGHHMRDLAALRQIVAECAARRLPVRFDLVLPQFYWPTFAGCNNAYPQTNVGEPELIQLYQSADALLLPLTDATANNAVLESLAVGTPVITNAVGGISDYLDDQSGWLFAPGDVTGMVELIAAMCTDRNIAASRREAARRQSLAFDWTKVAAQMREVYAAVISG